MHARRQGVTIIFVLLSMSILAVLATSLVLLGLGNLNTSFGNVESERALCAAEAGARRALLELGSNAAWENFSPAVQKLDYSDTTYEVHVYKDGGPPAPRGVVVPPGLLYVHSIGKTGSGRTREVGWMVRTGVGSGNYAVVADDQITVLANSMIDSRDPLTDLVLPDPADVAVNKAGGLLPVISLAINSRIEGSAYAGPGASSGSVSTSPGSTITGTIGSLRARIPLDPVSLPADPTFASPIVLAGGATERIGPGVYGPAVLAVDATLELEPGTYVFSTIRMIANSKLKLVNPGRTKIYVDNGMDIALGSFENVGRKPSDMQFLVKRGLVSIRTHSTASYVLYAPECPVLFADGGQCYGNLVGKSLTLAGGAALHFDPSSGGAGQDGGSTIAQTVSEQTF